MERSQAWTITFNSCKTCRLHFLHMGLANLWKCIHGNVAITLPIEIWLLLLRNNIPELVYSRKNIFLDKNFNYDKSLLSMAIFKFLIQK